MENRILPAENEVSMSKPTCRSEPIPKGQKEDTPENFAKLHRLMELQALAEDGLLVTYDKESKFTFEQVCKLMAELGLEVDSEWQAWGIVEIAVRNPQVAEYCEHWEGRAESAESRLASLPRTPAEVDAADPEEFCKQCLRPNISWFVRSDLWNRVMRRGSQPEPIICPVCFVKRAEMQRVEVTGWQLVPEDYDELQQKAEILAASSAQGQSAVEKSAGGQEPQKTTPKRSENQSLLLVELNELLKRFDISGGEALERTLEEHARWQKDESRRRLAELSAIVEPFRDLHDRSKAKSCRFADTVWAYQAANDLRQGLIDAFPKIAALVPPVEKGEKS